MDSILTSQMSHERTFGGIYRRPGLSGKISGFFPPFDINGSRGLLVSQDLRSVGVHSICAAYPAKALSVKSDLG